MQIDLPDDIMFNAEVNAADIQLAIAVQLYADNRIDHGEAVRISGLTISSFNHELLARGITVQIYPPSTLQAMRNAG